MSENKPMLFFYTPPAYLFFPPNIASPNSTFYFD